MAQGTPATLAIRSCCGTLESVALIGEGVMSWDRYDAVLILFHR